VKGNSKGQKPLELQRRTFNGNVVDDFFISRSQSVQCDTPMEDKIMPIDACPEVKTIPLASLQVNLSHQLARVREEPTFSQVRRYLAYYHKRDYGFKHESSLTLRQHMLSMGLPGTHKEISSLYYECLKDHFTVKEIKQDLANCEHMLMTERAVYLHRAQEVVYKRYGHNGYTKITSSAPFDSSVAQGRCDPECCTLM